MSRNMIKYFIVYDLSGLLKFLDIIAVTKKKGGSKMNRDELQEEIRFLYGLWYRYFNLHTYLQKNKRGLELIPKLRERQNEILRLIDFVKDQL